MSSNQERRRAERREVIGYMTYEGDRLYIVNLSETGILVSADNDALDVGAEFPTRVEIRERGEKQGFTASVRVVRTENGRVALELDKDEAA